MKYNIGKLKWDLIVLIICITIIVLHLLNLLNESGSEWIGFWGSLLGSGIGILGIYWQFHKQNLEEEKKELHGAINFFIIELEFIQKNLEFFKTTTLSYTSFGFSILNINDEKHSFIFRKYSEKCINEMLFKLAKKDTFKEILEILNFLTSLDTIMQKNLKVQNQKLDDIKSIYNVKLDGSIKLGQSSFV